MAKSYQLSKQLIVIALLSMMGIVGCNKSDVENVRSKTIGISPADTIGPSTDVIEFGLVSAGGTPVTVNLVNTYVSPVVVCSVQYNNNTIPVITRVSNVTDKSFDVRLQNPSEGTVAAENVSYIVVEEGTHSINGVNFEAQKYLSTVTDNANNWVGEAQSYKQSYSNPVVLGQVMSENDSDWSVFWSQGERLSNPPSVTTLRTGKMVGEDTDTTRADETIGFIVFEAGHGTIGGVEFEAFLGAKSIQGMGDSPPYVYDFNKSFASAPEVTLVTMAGMAGPNGGWAQTRGPVVTSSTSLSLSTDEDQTTDAERNHLAEQVGYVAFDTNPIPDPDSSVRFNLANRANRGSRGNLRNPNRGMIRRGGVATQNAAAVNTPDPLFNILLGRTTDKSVTANIVTRQDLEFYVEYGTSSGEYSKKTGTFNATAKEPVEFVIDGLSPNTKNFYRVVYREKGTTEWNKEPEHSVHTQRARGSSFTFTVASDSHLGQYGGVQPKEFELYNLTLKNILAEKPDFHIDDGDTFAMDPLPPYGTGLGTGMTEENADAAYYVQRPWLNTIGGDIPFFFVIGNHENEEGWNWDDTYPSGKKSVAIVGMRARKKYFPNPIPDDFYSGNTDALPPEFVAEYPELSKEDPYQEDYYSWEWGDALFVVLDPYHYSMKWPSEGGNGYGGEGTDNEPAGDRWDWTLGIKQYLWLKKTLENSNAKYKFVFSHQVTGGSTQYGRGGIGAAPYFEWGGKNLDGTWGWDTHRPAAEGWTVPIHQLFIDNDVDAYVHGHDHIYAYEKLDGIVYLEVPKPDDAGYDWEPYGYGYNEHLYPNAVEIQNSGHIRVTVSPDKATFDYVRSYLPGDGKNGEIAHSFTIPGDN